MNRQRSIVGWVIWAIIVVAVFVWLAREVIGAPAPPPLPPMPKIVKTKRLVTNTTQGSGAAALMAPRAVIPPAKTNYVVLSWTWTTNAMNRDRNDILFLVRSLQTNQFARPALSWPIVATTTNTRWTNAVDRAAKCAWFAVTASNKLTHYESDFATR